MDLRENTKYVVVNVTRAEIVLYKNDEESIEDVLNKAEQSKLDNIKLFERYIIDYPDSAELWNNYLIKNKEQVFKVMTMEEFNEFERNYYLSQELCEITEEDYNDALNVLPPLKWRTIDGVEMFLMSEFTTGSYTLQYAIYNGKYYCKTVDAYDTSTWINNLLN